LRGDVDEAVDFATVEVVDGQTGPRQGSMRGAVSGMGLLHVVVEELVELFVLGFGHGGFECEPVTRVLEDGLGQDGKEDALVRFLVDQAAELGFDLELDSTRLDLAHVRVHDDVLEEEVGDSLGEAVLWDGVGDGGLPWAEGAPGGRSCFRRGSGRSCGSGLLFFGRCVPAAMGVGGTSHYVVVELAVGKGLSIDDGAVEDSVRVVGCSAIDGLGPRGRSPVDSAFLLGLRLIRGGLL